MRATTFRFSRSRRLITASVITSVFALATLGGSALAADSRDFTVTVAAQQGEPGRRDRVHRARRQRAKPDDLDVKLSIPGIPTPTPAMTARPWPTGPITITAVYSARADNYTIA